MNYLSVKQSVSIATNKDFIQRIELLIELIKKDLKRKYKNTFLGILWIFLQPFLFAIVFVFIRRSISNNANLNAVDYLSMYAVLIPWQFFITSLQRSVDSIVVNNNLIYRVKFPIILLPLSVVLSSFIDSTINLLIYFFLILFFKKIIFLKIVNLFFVLLVSGIFISALCILVALFQCFIQDLRQIVPFLTKLSMFGLPILYGQELIIENFRNFYLNIPIVWMITKTSSIVSGVHSLPNAFTLNIFLISVVSFLLVYFVFKKMQSFIVDYI